MLCLYREGRRKCTWWIRGCVNPCVSISVKDACSGYISRYKTQDANTEHNFYRPENEEIAVTQFKDNGSKSLIGKK